MVKKVPFLGFRGGDRPNLPPRSAWFVAYIKHFKTTIACFVMVILYLGSGKTYNANSFKQLG